MLPWLTQYAHYPKMLWLMARELLYAVYATCEQASNSQRNSSVVSSLTCLLFHALIAPHTKNNKKVTMYHSHWKIMLPCGTYAAENNGLT